MLNIVRVFFLTFIIQFFAFFGYSQVKTRFGIQAGSKFSYYNFYDESGYLRNPVMPGFTYGFNISQEIKPFLGFETGFFHYQYWHGVNTIWDRGISMGNTLETFQIPIRFKYEIPVFNNQLTIGLHSGLTLGFNRIKATTNSSSFGESAMYNIGSDSIMYESIGYDALKKFFPLIETGIDFNIKLSDELFLTLSANHYAGLKQVFRNEVSIQKNLNPVQKGAYLSNGNNIEFLIGLSSPISSIWQNADFRKNTKNIRTKSYENSINKKYYLGLEGGIYWKKFAVSQKNNKIFQNDKSWPIWHYANAFFGINAGYRFHNNWGLETGFYTYQFRNDFSYLFYDNFISEYHDWYSFDRFRVIPFKVTFRKSFLSDRLFFTTSVGIKAYQSKRIGEYRHDEGYSYLINDDVVIDSLYIDYTFRRPNEISIGFTSSIGLEYYVYKNLILTLSAQFDFGFTPINQIEVNINHHGEMFNQTLNYLGRNMAFSFGLKVPF